MPVDSWRRADLVESKTSRSHCKANHIWRYNVGNNSNLRGDSGSSRNLRREPLTRATDVQQYIVQVDSPHHMDILSSLTSDLTSAVHRLRCFQSEGNKENKAKGQCSCPIRLVYASSHASMSGSLRLPWNFCGTIVRTTRQVSDADCTSVDPLFYLKWGP